MAERNRNVFSKCFLGLSIRIFVVALFLTSSLYDLVSHSCFMYVSYSPCSYEISLQVFSCVQELFKFSGIKTCFFYY